MKRAFSIVLALALVMTMMVASAAPAGAVSAGTVEVLFVPTCTNLAGQNATYAVIFHNRELLHGDDNDYIDIDFPAGTGFAGLVDVTVTTHATAAHARAGSNIVRTIGQNFTTPVTPSRTVRIRLAAGNFTAKSEYVRVVLEEITNPKSCDYFLQVGTSNVTPEPSATYTIYTLKIDLDPGKNLISVPAYPEDPAIEVVLAALFARAAATAGTAAPFTFSVWYWDAVNLKWLKYISDTSQSDLTTIEAGKAYWIKVSSDISFKFKGNPYPPCQGPPQKWCYPPSWSMIGIATTTPTAASEYLWDAMMPFPSHNTYAVSRIFLFESTATLVPEGNFADTGWRPGQRDLPGWQGFFPPVQPLPPYQDVELQPGVGYFMSFAGEACIIPPVA